MKSAVLSLLSALCGTFGFSVLFGVRPRRLPWTVLCGGLTWGVYLLTASLGTLAANAAAAFCMTLCSEIAARRQRAPVITFLTPAAVVLVPGGTLYYTLSSLLAKNYRAAGSYALLTADACLGIAGGILLASLCVTLALHLLPLLSRSGKR